MKKICSILLLAGISSNQLLAQCSNSILGLYKSKSDFDNKILTYQSKFNSVNTILIKLYDLFKSHYVTIKENGNKIKIAKDSIYGFKKSDNSIYRFQNNQVYKILDTSKAIIIYHMNLPQRQTGKINITRYTYSVGFNGIIKTLSINNLLEDFSSNTTFCKAIKVNFHYNTELVELDECTKQYKILNYFK